MLFHQPEYSRSMHFLLKTQYCTFLPDFLHSEEHHLHLLIRPSWNPPQTSPHLHLRNRPPPYHPNYLTNHPPSHHHQTVRLLNRHRRHPHRLRHLHRPGCLNRPDRSNPPQLLSVRFPHRSDSHLPHSEPHLPKWKATYPCTVPEPETSQGNA